MYHVQCHLPTTSKNAWNVIQLKESVICITTRMNSGGDPFCNIINNLKNKGVGGKKYPLKVYI